MLKKATALTIVVIAAFLFLKPRPSKIPPPKEPIPRNQIYQGSSYEPVNPDLFEVKLLADHLVSPTRIKMLPEGSYLLVTQLTGELIAFKRTSNDVWSNQADPVTVVSTRYPGFPPEEAGLTAVALSSDFARNRTAFLFYGYKDANVQHKNRIAKTVIKEIAGKLTGTPPQIIFESNTPGNPSHQIQEGIPVKIAGEPHLLFTIGEGLDGKKAQDPSLEAGKVMLIREDGSNPAGLRPYADPKVQALGIRNAFTLTPNPFDPRGKILLADTGPDRFDRLIYTNLFFPTGESQRALNLGWNGDEPKLADPIPDPNYPQVKDMVILRLPETRTFTGLLFHPGGTKGIPKSDANSQSVIATIFGKTGQPDPSPGKEIWLGKLTNLDSQPKIDFSPIIKRVGNAVGKLGNPIGLEIDPQTGNFFFADILEGRLYLVKPK